MTRSTILLFYSFTVALEKYNIGEVLLLPGQLLSVKLWKNVYLCLLPLVPLVYLCLCFTEFFFLGERMWLKRTSPSCHRPSLWCIMVFWCHCFHPPPPHLLMFLFKFKFYIPFLQSTKQLPKIKTQEAFCTPGCDLIASDWHLKH